MTDEELKAIRERNELRAFFAEEEICYDCSDIFGHNEPVSERTRPRAKADIDALLAEVERLRKRALDFGLESFIEGGD
jgi:hypothetical protein